MTKLRFAAIAATILTAGVSSAASTPGQLCEKAAGDSLRKCVAKVGKLQRACYQKTGSACLSGDTKIAAAHASLASSVTKRCPDQATITAALFGSLLTPSGLIARLDDACDDAVASVNARAYGGPHAAVRDTAGVADAKCLDGAHQQSLSAIDYALKQQSACILKAHQGGVCDTATLATKLSSRETKTAAKIASKCPTPTESLVTVDAPTLTARASAQARCLVASSHGQTSPLALDCGPRAAVSVPAPGVSTQIVLDNDEWGTRCGNGSQYAFWIRMAPAGSPPENVVVFMQGGGACYDGTTCSDQPPARFDSLSQNMPNNGLMSNTDANSPFRDWTKVYLPYCTQDLHIGGGVVNTFPEITVYRYGALNARAALSYARDAVWSRLDATDGDGYRSGRVRALISGGSAGGYGDMYNYHWVLDDLRWPHATAAPDSGLGMDNGTALGVITLGALALAPPPAGWAVGPYLPPYCATNTCAEIFDNLELATAPRLKMLPEQQVLNITNQIDQAQSSTTFFPSIVSFVNTMRTNYCGLQGGNGIHAFFSARTATQHVQVNSVWYHNAIVGGTSLADWLGGAMASPDAVVDKIGQGTLETDYPGIDPFPCTTSSPSGAFL